jgi:outer membrane PBP1 activator LpoA protein
MLHGDFKVMQLGIYRYRQYGQYCRNGARAAVSVLTIALTAVLTGCPTPTIKPPFEPVPEQPIPAQPPPSLVIRHEIPHEYPAASLPAQIALLLPLSGRQEAAGVAVREGFLCAYFQQKDSAQRPRVRVYDIADREIGGAYLHAIDDGAQFIVGPLTKDEVAGIAAIADGRVPVLTLNYLAEGTVVPQDFYQFALAPEDEARQVARRVIADGRPRGVALAPTGEWGTRVLNAFAAELGALGGELIARGIYDSSANDYSPEILQLLRLSDSRERHARLVAMLGSKLEFEPRRRGDIDFIFVVGQPAQGRLIRPQLKFYYAGDIPMYATSDVFEPDETANIDLDGVTFPDMPWMILSTPAAGELRASTQQVWPSSANRRGRLYAFGYDAYQLIPALRNHMLGATTILAGMTGQLTIDAQGHIHRELDWAQIRNGKPRALAMVTAPAAVAPQN